MPARARCPARYRQLRAERNVVESRWCRAIGHELECVTGCAKQRARDEADDDDERGKSVLQERASSTGHRDGGSVDVVGC